MKYLNLSIRTTLALLIMGVSISCMNSENRPEETTEIKYLPLGDSYTICTGSTAGNSWPELLTKHMVDSGFNFKLVDNPARNGFTCVDLIRYELPAFFEKKPDFVTICIGTNDWVSGYDSAQFTANLRYILDTIQATLHVKTNIVLLTVPDFSLTKSGPLYANGRNISEGLQSFNKIILAEAAARGLKSVDLFAISQDVKNDKFLISDDNLHPSDKGYAAWERNIFPIAKSQIQNKQ